MLTVTLISDPYSLIVGSPTLLVTSISVHSFYPEACPITEAMKTMESTVTVPEPVHYMLIYYL